MTSDNPTRIAAGPTHVCGVFDSILRCWGDNGLFQLGDAGGPGSVPIDEALEPFNNPVTIGEMSLGYVHTCAEVDLQVRCWGNNANKELGPGEMNSSTDQANAVGLSNVESLSAGGTFTCAVASGEIYCWGDNRDRQLGRGPGQNENSYATPEPVVTPW